MVDAHAFPQRCSNEPVNSMKILSVTYPDEGDTVTECNAGSRELDTTWSYNPEPADGDLVCAYIDGVLFDQYAMSQSRKYTEQTRLVNGVFAHTSLTDLRAISGVLYTDSHTTLLASFSFDEAREREAS